MSAKVYISEKERRKAAYQRAKSRRLASVPADPITFLTAEERAYIAGLTDGDGCFRISYVGPKRQYFYPMFMIGMTHEPVILWLRDKLSMGTVKLNNHTAMNRDPNWKPQWIVRLYGKRTKLLCAALLPYLIVKKEQAECILAFPVEGRRGPGQPLPAGMAEERRRLAERMTILNRRGPNPTP